RMASDLVKRYEKAGVDPRVALYVDCGCCPGTVFRRCGLASDQGGVGSPLLTEDTRSRHHSQAVGGGVCCSAHRVPWQRLPWFSSVCLRENRAHLAAPEEACEVQPRSSGCCSLH
ncbi:hypothetical protein GOODEAATRI_033469, partial [Goodea atripinnis]